MRITIFGSGYVGLVTGACLADVGHDVICVDVDDADQLLAAAVRDAREEPGVDVAPEDGGRAKKHFAVTRAGVGSVHDTREALTMALAQFDGTLILVSHDRHLLRATTDQFLLVGQGTVAPFDGDLDDYRDWLLKQAAAKRAAASAQTASTDADGAPATNRRDQKREQSIQLIHYDAPFLHALIQRSYNTGTTPPCCNTSTPDGSRYAFR